MSAVEPLPTTSAADAVLNALPHPVIVVSSDGKVVDANVAAVQEVADDGQAVPHALVCEVFAGMVALTVEHR